MKEENSLWNPCVKMLKNGSQILGPQHSLNEISDKTSPNPTACRALRSCLACDHSAKCIVRVFSFFKTLAVYVQTLASEAKWKKIYIYIYIETWKFIREIRIITYPFKAAIFFAPGSAPELAELLDPPGKGDRGRSENRHRKL